MPAAHPYQAQSAVLPAIQSDGFSDVNVSWVVATRSTTLFLRQFYHMLPSSSVENRLSSIRRGSTLWTETMLDRFIIYPKLNMTLPFEKTRNYPAWHVYLENHCPWTEKTEMQTPENSRDSERLRWPWCSPMVTRSAALATSMSVFICSHDAKVSLPKSTAWTPLCYINCFRALMWMVYNNTTTRYEDLFASWDLNTFSNSYLY